MAIAVAFVGSMAFRLSVPAIAYHVRSSLGGSLLQLGSLTVAFFIARASSAVLAGRRIERGVNVGLLAASCFMAHAGIVVLYGLASSWHEVLLLRVLQGALNGVSWTSMQFAVGASARTNVRGRAYSAYFIMGSVGVFMGNVVFACMASAPLMDVVCVSALLMLITGLLSIPVGRMAGHEGRRRRASSPGSSRPLSGPRLLPWVLVVVFASRALSCLFMGDIIYVYLSEGLGIEPSLASLLVGSGTVVGQAGGFLMMWVADKKSDRASLALASSMAVVGSLAFPMRHPVLSVAGYLAMALGVMSFTPLVRRVVMTYSGRRGLAIGLVNAAGNVGTASNSLALGALLDAMGMSSIYMAGLEFIGAMLIMSAGPALAIALSAILLWRTLRALEHRGP